MFSLVVQSLNVWVEYLVFVFNLSSVWANLCTQCSVKCLWNSNDLSCMQYTAVTIWSWCLYVSRGIIVVCLRVVAKCWKAHLSCKNTVTNTNTSVLMHFFLLEDLRCFFFLFVLLKWKKSEKTLSPNSNKPILPEVPLCFSENISCNFIFVFWCCIFFFFFLKQCFLWSINLHCFKVVCC